jgi:hypothetical protein
MASSEEFEVMLNETFNAFIHQLQITVKNCPSLIPSARIAQKFCINTELQHHRQGDVTVQASSRSVLGGFFQ